MQDEVWLHDAHRLQATLDVGYGGIVLGEHRQQRNRSKAFDKLATDFSREAAVLGSVVRLTLRWFDDIAHCWRLAIRLLLLVPS